jgi:hypothetical protein
VSVEGEEESGWVNEIDCGRMSGMLTEIATVRKSHPVSYILLEDWFHNSYCFVYFYCLLFYVFFLLRMFCSVYSVFIVPTGTLPLP